MSDAPSSRGQREAPRGASARRHWLLRLFAFVSSAAAGSLLAALVLSTLFPGRGFLPAHRGYVQIDMVRGDSGDWEVASVAHVSAEHWSAPDDGVRILVQESSMGRTQPGRLGAWRARTWMVQDVLPAPTRGSDRGSLAPGEEWNTNQLRLADAVAAVIEAKVIPDSALWDAWPTGDQRLPIRMTWPASRSLAEFEATLRLGWTNWARSALTPAFWVVVGIGFVIGTIVTHPITWRIEGR